MEVVERILIVCLLVAAVAGAATAASPAPAQAARPQSFWVRGIVVSVKDNALIIKVTSAPRPVTRYEQKGELTIVLAPKAAIRMGSKSIKATMIKANERVSVSGTYKPGDSPTFQATTVTVYAK